jgi:hypothetical protein
MNCELEAAYIIRVWLNCTRTCCEHQVVNVVIVARQVEE